MIVVAPSQGLERLQQQDGLRAEARRGRAQAKGAFLCGDDNGAFPREFGAGVVGVRAQYVARGAEQKVLGDQGKAGNAGGRNMARRRGVIDRGEGPVRPDDFELPRDAGIFGERGPRDVLGRGPVRLVQERMNIAAKTAWRRAGTARANHSDLQLAIVAQNRHHIRQDADVFDALEKGHGNLGLVNLE